ncbi:MAG: VCBS repeat-containing protein, partial [Elusimicrobiales bacterium]|nr:VCBS repeat-containing protein [Elusimicrobiales bacterium]
AEIGAAPADNFEPLGFCWGARLEIGGAGPEVKEEVARERAGFLDKPAPSPELLYSLYKGYYYLQERDKGRQLLLRLAAMDADPSLAGSIAGSLFEEIIATAPGSEIRVKLAASYLDNFPEEKMADKAALVVLSSLSTSRDGEIDHSQLVRTFLENRPESLLIRGAAAYWLLERETGYLYAAELLEENLRALEDYLATRPPHFSAALWEEQVEEKRAFYRYLLGRAWLGLGEAGKAALLLDEVLGDRRDWPGVYHFRGLSAIRLGQIVQAVDFLRMALAAGSERPETERLLSDLLRDRYGFSGEPQAYFQRRESGVSFREVSGELGLDGVKAHRAAWGDYDNDGDDDLLLDGLRLFTNMGAAGFAESNRLIPSGLGPASGGVWGDYDNDRFLDIAVTARGGSFLLHNEAGEGFTRVELPPSAALFDVNPEAAAWGELNND